MFKGVYPAVVTPFKEDYSLDLKSFNNLIIKLVDSGVDGLVISGSTGEAPYLKDDEKEMLFKSARDTLGNQVKLIAGCGGASLYKTLNYIKSAEKSDYDGLLIITPYYFRPTQKQLIKYYNEVSKNTNIPILLYNFPQTTGVIIEPETAFKLIDGENIIGIKDSSGELRSIIQLKYYLGENGNILVGNTKISLSSIFMGADGLILAIANILPYTFKEIFRYMMNKEYEKASRIFWEIYPVIDIVEKGGISTIKYILDKMGFSPGPPRPPLQKIGYIKQEENVIKILKEREKMF